MSIRLRTLLLLAVGALILGCLLLVSGVVPIRASDGHWRITSVLLDFAKHRSVATYARGTEVPELTPRMVRIGAGHYESGCRYCHGAPGIRMPVVPGESTPHPPPLYSAPHEYSAAELFQIVKHGIKFTGMPGWPTLARDDEVWAMVAFLREFDELAYADYREMVFALDVSQETPYLVQVRCARCHGDDGSGRGHDAFPRIGGQPLLVLEDALRAYATGARRSGIMEPLAADLSADELREAARWYASRPPAPVVQAEVEPELLTLGASIAQRGLPERDIPPCASCHDGTEHPDYPRLNAQWPAYIEDQLRLWATGVRGGGQYASVMQAVAEHSLEPDEMRAVAAHFGRTP